MNGKEGVKSMSEGVAQHKGFIPIYTTPLNYKRDFRWSYLRLHGQLRAFLKQTVKEWEF